ncbi:MAG: CPBP family intramembrane glutamic endopeptidase [Trueperaceae bacterium]|nr:CPBP family intramembrane glutamic endopeptidase [Trueperaceae bacterium]
MTRQAWTLLAFAPSLLGGVVAAVWWSLAPPTLTPRMPLLPSLALGAATGLALLAAAAGLERVLPSFRWASRVMERALARLAPSRPMAASLALATSLGEELLFRGMLLAHLGLVVQAVLFGALHPLGRRGWSYPVFAALAGLAFGALVLATGRLLPAIVAHLIVNATGLLLGRGGRRRPPRRRVSPGASPPAAPPP